LSLLIYLYSSKGYGKDSDMSDGAEVGSGIEVFGCKIPHEERK